VRYQGSTFSNCSTHRARFGIANRQFNLSEPFAGSSTNWARHLMWIVAAEAVEKFGDLKEGGPASAPAPGSRTIRHQRAGFFFFFFFFFFYFFFFFFFFFEKLRCEP